jgi:hypothetical protein
MKLLAEGSLEPLLNFATIYGHIQIGKGYQADPKLKPTNVLVSGAMRIDTGAQRTVIDTAVARQLALPTNGRVLNYVVGTQRISVTCPIEVCFPPTSLSVTIDKAISADLSKQGIIALLGCDLLEDCSFFYDGVAKLYRLELIK